MTGAEPILGYSLIEWLSLYGYWILIPLLIVEGPVVGFTAGILISYGVFDPLLVFVIYVLATTTSDTALYLLGRYGQVYLMRFSYSRRIIEAIHRDRDKPDRGWSNVLEDHFTKFFVLAKVTPTVSVSEALAIAAGILHVNPKKVYIGILIAQPVWSAAILALGFYFGNTIQDFGYVLNVTGIIITALIVLVILYFIFLHQRIMEETTFGKMIRAWQNSRNGQVAQK